jgi:hypothetical protein
MKDKNLNNKQDLREITYNLVGKKGTTFSREDLIADTDQFDNTGYTPEQIEASKIIKYAAVTESDAESRLIIKVATENADEVFVIFLAF